jgi:hypothetical protein
MMRDREFPAGSITQVLRPIPVPAPAGCAGLGLPGRLDTGSFSSPEEGYGTTDRAKASTPTRAAGVLKGPPEKSPAVFSEKKSEYPFQSLRTALLYL